MTINATRALPRTSILLLLALVGACAVAAFGGLVTFGAIGGTSIGVAPEWTFERVKPLICGGESRLEFTAVRRSYHRPGESEPHLECVAADGTRRDVLWQGIVAVLGTAFVAVFVALCLSSLIPAAVLIWAAHRLRRSANSAYRG